MKASLTRIGNSQGVIIPKPLLAQIGLSGEIELTVEHDAIVLRKPKATARAGWADASRSIMSTDDGELVWPEFGNAGDNELTW